MNDASLEIDSTKGSFGRPSSAATGTRAVSALIVEKATPETTLPFSAFVTAGIPSEVVRMMTRLVSE